MSETKVRVRSTLGVTDHNLLDNRFTNDQHTINSISGLEDALESKQKKLIPGENIEITSNGEISAIIPEVSFANITGEVTDNTNLSNVLAEKANVDDVPVNTSDLNNDSDFITHTDIEGKQDVINDLSAIRNGAALGATALQNINSDDVTTALGYTPYDSANPNNYATESAVATKQDALNSDQLAAVNSGANTTNINQIATNTSAIEGIESKIPSQASAQNQLADRDFVNSSIATSTATFRGTYESVSELNAYSGPKDNNDYAFVTGEDELGNAYYDNYVYDGTNWVKRYRLNNSSFTSAQWDAINSGATTTNIAQIATNTTAISGKQDIINDLSTIRSGAALGTTALQEVTSNDVTTALGYTPYSSSNPSGYITNSALNGYARSSDLASVATSGSYNDLSNKPTIPAAQVNADWNASSGVAEILNKPTIPTVNNSTITLTQGGTTKGTFTLNQSSNSTIDFDMGGSSVEPDESSINFNSANKLQSVGFINARTGSAMRLWEGTESQWNTGASQTWYNWADVYNFTWTSNSNLPSWSSSGKSWGKVAYGSNVFVAIDTSSYSGSHYIATSRDGITWSLQASINLSSSIEFKNIAFGGENAFVIILKKGNKALYYDYNIPQTIYSKDLPIEGNWNAITYGKASSSYKKFVIVGVDDNGYMTAVESKFGLSWVKCDCHYEENTLSGVAYGNDYFIAIAANSNKTYRADILYDPLSFTRTGVGLLPANRDWSSIAYGKGKFIAVANNSNKGAYSTNNGTSWIELSLPTTLSGTCNIIYANNVFVIYATTSNTFMYSVDGINWKTSTFPNANKITGMCYGDDKFLTVKSESSVVNISDGPSIRQSYTTSATPTTSDTVYSAPNTTSALTITSVGTGTITLSDNNTYSYNSVGDQITYQSVGEAHPDWLCFIEGVGVKKGTTTIASIAPTVDQTYDATSTNAQSGVAVASGISDTLGTINTQLESIIAQGD